MNQKWISVGAFLLAIAVGFGAFGAHGLKDKLDAYSMAVYEKATFYHFMHGLGILIISILAVLDTVPASKAGKICAIFAVGIILFSGSLYLLAITRIKWLGAITPLGGSAFIIGWVLLAIAALKGSGK